MSANTPVRPPRVYGVDFSGAVDAGKKIWIASGRFEGPALRIETCARAESLPGSARDRDRCLAALRDLIQGATDSAFGFDFPFSLPWKLVKEKNWEGFVRLFKGRYATPDKFRAACRSAGGGRELRRSTDEDAKTPFSPYNLRLYKQTYYGIRDLLAPLVASRTVRVLPMQEAVPEKAWILEICPASLLKLQGLYGHPYKGKTPSHCSARLDILQHFEKEGSLAIPALQVLDTILADPGGDALDSVLAALATFRALRNPGSLFPLAKKTYALEGYVYV